MSEAGREGASAAVTPLGHDGAWHFILIRKAKDADTGRLAAVVRKALAEAGLTVQVRDWRGTAGAGAMYVYLMQIILYIGLFMLGGIVLILTINSLVMSVFERTPEIGTMRAVGAQRGFIRGLFVVETTALTLLCRALPESCWALFSCSFSTESRCISRTRSSSFSSGGLRFSPGISTGKRGHFAARLGYPRFFCMDLSGSAGSSHPTRQGNPRRLMRATTLQIAFRNFTRNGRRFLLLGLAVCAGFFFVCTVQSLVSGLSNQINIAGSQVLRRTRHHPL